MALRAVVQHDVCSFVEHTRGWLVAQLPDSNLLLGASGMVLNGAHSSPFCGIVYREQAVVAVVLGTPPLATLVHVDREFERAADIDLMCAVALEIVEPLVAYLRHHTKLDRPPPGIQGPPRFSTIMTALVARALDPSWSRPILGGSRSPALELGISINDHSEADPDQRWEVQIRQRMLWLTLLENAPKAPAGVGVLGMPPRDRVAPGRMRLAAGSELETIVEWLVDFDVFMGDAADHDEARDGAAARVQALIDSERLFVWERPSDSAIVSMAIVARPIDDFSISISTVYTPAEHRGHGYAHNLVAHVARLMLARDDTEAPSSASKRSYPFVMIHVDSAASVPNGVYERVGFREAAMLLETKLLVTSS